MTNARHTRCRSAAGRFVLLLWAALGLSVHAVQAQAVWKYLFDGVEVSPGQEITLAPAEVGQSSSGTFTVANVSSTNQTIYKIDYPGGVFVQCSQAQPLPATLSAGSSLRFDLCFRPTIPGPGRASIAIDARTFYLTSNGVVRARLSLSSGESLTPAQQPRVSLSLARSVSVVLSGTLTLTFAPNNATGSDDPAIQFETEGRTVEFTVPKDSPDAVFSNGRTDVKFQAGTVAGAITLTAELRLDAYRVTASPAPQVTATIGQLAPTILGVRIDGQACSGFTLVITGFSTPREVTKVVLRLNAATGATATPNATDLEALGFNTKQEFDQYYQSPDGRKFGSQFVLQIPATCQGDWRALGSVTVTVSNSVGSSQSYEQRF